MHFSEDEVRHALRREDPGESFTKEVMARVALRQAQGAITPNPSERFRELWRGLRLRPALASALIAILVFGGLLGLVEYRRVQEQRAGEAAKKQALLALRITNAKLNHVFERVKTAPSP
jgi:hypothetical protein